jgi:hypothetical protein
VLDTINHHDKTDISLDRMETVVGNIRMIRVCSDTNLIGKNAEQDSDEYLALSQLRELTNPDGSKVIIETISNRNLNE